MKRIYTVIVVFTALWASSSCAKQELYPPVDDNRVFYGYISETESTKTFIEGFKIKWQNNDRVRINGAEYKAEVDSSDPTHAIFSLADGTPTMEGELNTAVFPSSLYHDAPSPYYELPSEFDYDSGRYDIPMYAESKSQKLLFNSMFATLKICLPDGYVAQSLRVSSDMYLNGKFNINTDYLSYVNYVQAEMVNGTEQNKVTTVHFKPEITGGDVYIPVPANTYAGKNLRFTLTCNDGVKLEMTTNQNSEITILAGTLYTFNFRRDGCFDIMKEGEIGYNDIL